MNTFKHKILSILALIAICVVAAPETKADETAAAIMQRCADKFKNAPAITVNFAIANTAEPLTGTITMSRTKFNILTPAISIWFDGKTQWTYLNENKEVNITEPTREELMESNPFELLANFNAYFKCRKLKAPLGCDLIELTPKAQGQSVSTAKITIDKKSGWPTALNITFANGNTSSISVTKVTPLKSVTNKQFTFDQTAHPTSEIVDLR